MNQKINRNLLIFMIVVALVGLANGLSDGIFANYFKSVYQVTALQRGMIEFPRELPGVLGIVVISLLIQLGDQKIGLVALLLSAGGILVLGFWTPSFIMMWLFLFIYSLGMHVWMPLQDSIAVDLSEKQLAGQRLGQINGLKTGTMLLAALIVFFGFRFQWFTFDSPILVFIIAGLAYLIAFGVMTLIKTQATSEPTKKLIVRKQYGWYYLLTILIGVQKQIMLVFAPWLLVDLLHQGPETLAVVSMVSSLVGVFFLPAVGKWIDKLGIRKILYFDAYSFVIVYFLYGLLALAITNNYFTSLTIPVVLGGLMYVLDRISMNFGLVRTMYLRHILVEKQEFASTLAFGISLDHIVTIACASVSGLVWMTFGPQYVFFFASGLSLINVLVAYKVKL
jgi:hypothetical protein